MKAENTVSFNVQRLIGYNRSMAVALEKAENGSSVEHSYFVEKLEKTANALNFTLIQKIHTNE